MTTAYISLLHDCFRDEVWGERFYALLAEKRKRAHRQLAVIRVLMTVEEAMQQHLGLLLHRHGLSGGVGVNDEDADAKATELAAHYSGVSWDIFILKFETSIPPFVTKYRRLLAMAPGKDREIVQLLLTMSALSTSSQRWNVRGDSEAA
ncbi:hypothetical protein [Burkholderia anthina]|uniref:hypothetical protein n=1 Tax=Burkholderia anthina TaxID=179879 RepID=UPI001AA04603|nr:hypothetical protein [Burkholderia anthina]QTD95156.1 hypothetical protein J4G50_34680 [Burkholderia anthina]